MLLLSIALISGHLLLVLHLYHLLLSQILLKHLLHLDIRLLTLEVLLKLIPDDLGVLQILTRVNLVLLLLVGL